MNIQDKFNLSPVLERDSILVKELSLCQVRIIKDGELDWFILVPQINGIKEIFQLSEVDQITLLSEINHISKVLDATVGPDKLNVAAIGNMVPQLHIHIVARFKEDRAWPGTIWGTSSNIAFSETKVEAWRSKF